MQGFGLLGVEGFRCLEVQGLGVWCSRFRSQGIEGFRCLGV